MSTLLSGVEAGQACFLVGGGRSCRSFGWGAKERYDETGRRAAARGASPPAAAGTSE